MFTVSVRRRPLCSLVLVTVVTVVGVGYPDLVTELPRLRAVLDVPLLQASTLLYSVPLYCRVPACTGPCTPPCSSPRSSPRHSRTPGQTCKPCLTIFDNVSQVLGASSNIVYTSAWPPVPTYCSTEARW